MSRGKVIRTLQMSSLLAPLTEATDLSQSAVSHHLAALRLAKLVKVRREGRWIFYVADTDCLAVCCRRLFEQLNVRKKVSG
ncbi:MAG: helix-turn-helix domain-containing protein [Anaerolineae bacterium]|nr:helix-turn-helix domain-containing protein [Anaerolineae bacterium]